MAMQYSEQHRNTIIIDTHGDTPGIAILTGIYKGLDFYQQGACAFPQNHHQATGRNLLCARQEYG